MVSQNANNRARGTEGMHAPVKRIAKDKPAYAKAEEGCEKHAYLIIRLHAIDNQMEHGSPFRK